jgi:hypothetical protein
MAPAQKMCNGGTSKRRHLADVAAFGTWGGRIMKNCRTCAAKATAHQKKNDKKLEAKVAKAKAAKAQAEANATEAAKAKDRAVAQAEAAVKTPIDLCSPSPPPPTSRTNTEVADITEDGLVSSPASDTLAIFCKASPRIRLLYTSQCFFNPRSQTENRSRSMSITGLVSTSSVSDLSSRVSEAERRGVPVTELKEGLLAHVDSRYVKTGRGARSTCVGIDVRQDLGGRYDIEFVVGGGRFKSAQGDWSPITYTVVQGLVASG